MDIRIRAIAEPDDIDVIKMRIRCEPSFHII